MASLIQRMIRASRLEAALYEEVEADRTAMGQAMAVVALSSLAAGLGAERSGPIGIVSGVLVAWLGWLLWAWLTWVIGTKLLPEAQTEADLGQLLRTTGFSAAPGLLRLAGFLPLVGRGVVAVANVWMLAAMVVAVRQALDYRGTVRAVAVCLLGWLVYVVLGALIGFAFVHQTGGVAA